MSGFWDKWQIPAKSETLSLKLPYQDPAIVQRLSHQVSRFLEPLPRDRRIVVVCVGTDRSTGDSLGPLVGTMLERETSQHFDLYGTLDEPVHAMNLSETLNKIMRHCRDPFIIAVDACLGQVSSVGCIQLGTGPVRPGAGVNKELPPVGDIHLTGIVNVGGFMEYFVLQNTRLNLVMKMAERIANSVLKAIHHTRGEFIPYAMPD